MKHANKLNDGKKVGILGGTFNPIHNGHINIAKAALTECGLDEVWFIPNGCPPHKNIEDSITAISRYNMVSATVSREANFYINDIELSSIDYNYTHITLRELHEAFPNNSYYFIMGEDSLESFGSWRKPELICQYATIVVATRSNNSTSIVNLISDYSKKYNSKFILLHCDYIDVSSTALRNKMISDGLDFEANIPIEASKYIHEHMLYEDINYSKFASYEDIKADLSDILKPTRYEHTMGVMFTAINLGMRYDVPLELCRYAGLLHDNAKSYTKEELIKFCEEKGIAITKSEYKAPHLLHCKVGAYIAENKYNVDDVRILNAILNHTTGAPDMSLLEQIVFVADYIEPRRYKANRLSEIRAMAYYDIDIATAMILQDTINYLKDIDAYIDERTINTYEYYKELVK